MTADDSDAHGGDEEFYETLDRILSSSCSSTSASDDDSATGDRRRRRGGISSSSSLLLPSSLDVWTSEPASVAERRRRLLQCLGLAGDPTLSHLRSVAHSPADAAGEAETRRSAQCEDLFPRRRDHHSGTGAGAVAVRTRSDGSVDPGFVNRNGGKTKPQHQHQRSIQFPVSSKPPLGARSRASSMGALDVVPDAGAGGDFRDDSEDSCSDPRCLIKNLDTGREFVVNEFREDGTWNKLREVATGRQLTMEEFEMCVGRSPIVQELMRRQSVDESANSGDSCEADDVARTGAGSNGGTRPKKRGGWLRSIRNVAGTMVGGGYRDRKSSDEKDTSSEKGGGRSSSATDDSQDGGSQHGFERIKVRQYGKSHKELTGMYLSQEIQAHKGPIWCIKFSLDGRYLASAGEDCVIHVWEVLETDRRAEFLNEKASDEIGVCNPFVVAISNGSPEPSVALACAERSHGEKKRRSKIPGSRKSVSSDPLMVPEHMFTLSERPVCSFKGHLNDVLDLSWSKSKYLLSSSMDKTVRLWHMSSNSCLKTFSHSDYVTCIQFNPVDDRYFISGSLDEKVRIWNIPERQIVDWTDLHEMVTSACYTPDGKGALVGSHKGGCHLYDTSDNKLLQRHQVDLENKKKSRHKKITGFQFAPGSSSKVLITSADSRIRIVDGEELVHKFKGFRNTSSQISACFTANGKYVICASEDSNVYVWRYDDDSRPNRSKGATVTQYYEHFHCQGVTVAVPWPNTATGEMSRTNSNKQQQKDGELQRDLRLMSEINSNLLSSPLTHQCLDCQPHSVLNPCSNRFSDRVSATWPEELMTTSKQSPRSDNSDLCNGGVGAPSRSAWGLVIVTADHDGGIRTFQNFGFPIRV